jgi:hypothetical protein
MLPWQPEELTATDQSEIFRDSNHGEKGYGGNERETVFVYLDSVLENVQL